MIHQIIMSLLLWINRLEEGEHALEKQWKT